MPGVDPVWLGIMMAMNLQTSYMHPPLGPTLFYLRGVAPPEITTRHIYVGIIPFVLIQLVALVVLWFVPGFGDRAAARALWALTSAQAGQNRSTAIQSQTVAGQQQRQQNGGRAHVLDALEREVMVAADAVGQFLDRGIEQLDDQDDDQRADQCETPAASAVRKKASGTPIASTTNSSRNACSDRAAATRPFQLLRVARQSRFTPSAPAQNRRLRYKSFP